MTLARTCQTCDNPVRDTFLCRRCTWQLQCALADQAAHHDDLTTTLTRLINTNPQNSAIKRTKRSTEWASIGEWHLDTITPETLRWLSPPARAAAQALSDQWYLLASWCRTLTEVHDVPLPPDDTVPVMAAHMIANLKTLARNPAVGDIAPTAPRHLRKGLFVEIRDLTARIIRAIDLPQDRSRIHVGNCPETITAEPDGDEQEEREEPCPGQVTAYFPGDKTKRPYMRCGYCQTEWASEQWATVGDRITKQQNQGAA